MAPTKDGDGGSSNHSNGPGKKSKTKRSRWATRKMTVKSSGIKRLSLIGRQTIKSTSSEKKRQSGGSETLKSQPNGDHGDHADDDAADSDHEAGPRQLYFNLPLPKELVDEDGNPLQTYTRNKIRTAKYTPLSFIPKNLWFQFHNIANIFFLFLVILVVSASLPSNYLALCSIPTANPSDLPCIRWRKPRAKLCTIDMYCGPVCHQGRC